MGIKKVSPLDYKRLFEETAGGAEVLDELTRRFGGSIFVKGGPEGDRQTWFKAGQRDVLDFILRQLNLADGVNDDVEA